MALPSVPRIKFGIPKLDAALLQWAQAIYTALNVRGVWPIQVKRSAAGIVVSYAGSQTFQVRLTSSLGSGAYAWEEVGATASGAWATFPGSTTGGSADPAYEFNLNASIDLTSNVYVRVERFLTTGSLRFQLDACSTSSSTTMGIPSYTTRIDKPSVRGVF